MKLDYFKELGWPTSWIDTAEAITHRIFERDYAHLPGPAGSSLPTPSASAAPAARSAASGSTFASLPYPRTGRTVLSELDEYLAAPIVKTDNPLQYWHLRRLESPRVARFALDYLSIPREFYLFLCDPTSKPLIATSTGVERVFSAGRQLLSYTQNRLLGPSIRANMCLGSWCRHDLIPFSILMGVI